MSKAVHSQNNWLPSCFSQVPRKPSANIHTGAYLMKPRRLFLCNYAFIVPTFTIFHHSSISMLSPLILYIYSKCNSVKGNKRTTWTDPHPFVTTSALISLSDMEFGRVPKSPASRTYYFPKKSSWLGSENCWQEADFKEIGKLSNGDLGTIWSNYGQKITGHKESSDLPAANCRVTSGLRFIASKPTVFWIRYYIRYFLYIS